MFYIMKIWAVFDASLSEQEISVESLWARSSVYHVLSLEGEAAHHAAFGQLIFISKPKS